MLQMYLAFDQSLGCVCFLILFSKLKKISITIKIKSHTVTYTVIYVVNIMILMCRGKKVSKTQYAAS